MSSQQILIRIVWNFPMTSLFSFGEKQMVLPCSLRNTAGLLLKLYPQRNLKVDIRCEKREGRPREDIHTHKLPPLFAGRSVGKCCGRQVLLLNSKRQHSFSNVLIFKLLE